MSTLTALEDQVTRMLLDGDDEALAVLRQQMEHATVILRKMTGVGFFTSFVVPPDVTQLAGHPSFKLGDVNGTAANVRHGLGFLLFVVDGVISMLEGYTYDDQWPPEVEELVLTYSGGQSRDIDKVRSVIHPA
jgi:hypothetical protein